MSPGRRFARPRIDGAPGRLPPGGGARPGADDPAIVGAGPRLDRGPA